jgi:acyl-CoA synthetase (AMP-forming)/AMP-acid ligase II
MALHFADLFEHAADAVPERVAVVCEDRQLTFRELEERSNRLAHHLTALGVRPGDHVGLYARNSIEAVEALVATIKLRAAAVNINYRYVEGELRYMFNDADLVALVHDAELTDTVAAARTGPQGDGAPTLRGTVAIGPDFDKALADASPERDFGPRSPDDVYIIYTGGTTGHPKGVMWRHEDIWRTLGGGIDFVTGEPLEDEWAQSRNGVESGGMVRLCAAPLIHGNAQVATLASLFMGDAVILLPRFDPVKMWQAIERHQVNVLVLTGDAMARPLIETYQKGGFDASSLFAVSSSAALFSPVVKEAWATAVPNAVITEAIGSTETGFAGLGFVTAGEAAYTGITVTPGPDVLVLDDNGRPCGPGEVGWLARGGHVSLGYYKDPVKTAKLFAEVDGKRYSMPGDMARVEEDGSITLLGRGNTSVNTGGEKVYPEEVEGALKSHPDVFDALVIGVPDERLGQRVAAVVQPREGCEDLNLVDVEAHVRKQIAGYKVPRSVWVADAVRRTASGKADYAWAREYAAAHEAAAG